MQTLVTLVWVMVGGALGAATRFAVSDGVGRVAGRGAVPWATLLVNVLGCLLIGYVAGQFVGERRPTLALLANRPLVVTGFCGALTTFSTFGLEVLELWGRRGGAWAAGLVALHLTLGLAAVMLGRSLA